MDEVFAMLGNRLPNTDPRNGRRFDPPSMISFDGPAMTSPLAFISELTQAANEVDKLTKPKCTRLLRKAATENGSEG
jgi:hypothetical protein